MQATIPDPYRGSTPGAHFHPAVLPTGQPAPAVGVQGGQGPVPAMVTPRASGHSPAWDDAPPDSPISFATPGAGVFLDDSGEEVCTQYNMLLAELWKDGIVPELRLAALMNFRTSIQPMINNAMRLLRVDLAMTLMSRAPDDYSAVARTLRPLVACEIPPFYDGFLLYGVTVANANLANVDFGGGALQADMVFLPAQGPVLLQLSRSPQPVQQPGMSPPPPEPQFTSSPSPSPLSARRDIVPQHTVPRLVLNGPGHARQRKQPAQSQ